MTERYNVVSPHTGSNGKTYWTKLGVAFPNKNGTGFNLFLRAIPAPEDGAYKIMLLPPSDPSQEQRRNDPPPDLDDEIPY